MNGTWAYAKSEHRAIQEENLFRRQLAQLEGKPCFERDYVSGAPICPDSPELVDESWQQGIICF